jgi:16S rRNA (uracil1498-N3)-methyltransferase
MNLLLLRADELRDDGRAELEDRRAAHLITTLGVAPGRRLRAGILDGAIGEALVEKVEGARVTLRCRCTDPPPPRGDDTLILAVPRPKVLGRCIESATALGFARIVIVRSWFTDKSHLSSAALREARLDARVLAGLEQSRRTLRPAVHVEALFRPFVEDRLDALLGAARRYTADQDAPIDLVDAAPRRDEAFALAIGPERGFNEFELGLLDAHGFCRVHAGHHPLRVETAVAALSAQLDALRRSAAGAREACHRARQAADP